METMIATKNGKIEQKINLIKGSFSASEAADVINSVLKVKINFHKLHRLSVTEVNLNDSCEFDNARIDELLNEQRIAKDFFRNAQLEGKKLTIRSTIHITVED